MSDWLPENHGPKYVMGRAKYLKCDKCGRTLDIEVRDHGNVGTALEWAAALGWQHDYGSDVTVCPYHKSNTALVDLTDQK